MRVCTKFAHQTNESAQRELALLLHRGAQLVNLTIYWCPICRAQHVGNKPHSPASRRFVPERPAHRERIPSDIRAMFVPCGKRRTQT